MEKNGVKTNIDTRIQTLEYISDVLSRSALARRLGWQYGDDRKLYQALGYPEEKDLDFKYYFNKYDRQDIATAIIDRPVEATWSGSIELSEEGKTVEESELNKAWQQLESDFHIKARLAKLDKLTGIGQFGILLFGFDDVKEKEHWKTPATGKRKLLYLKQYSEQSVSIKEWESNASNPRYGLPKVYEIEVGQVSNDNTTKIMVHHTRVLHVVDHNLLGEVYGRPRLKPIINRLNDLEKILGGDAEMFWRGARPGYHAAAQPDYEMGETELEALEDELDKYEHDLRRFISAKGVDIKALEQQIADPLNHIDAQLQAISSQTGIPKRILIGSERGELSSTQDKDQWLTLIQNRMKEFAEPNILRPFIERCIEFGILPDIKEFDVLWEDIFAPSEKEKVDIGKIRSEALKTYSENPFASDLMPPEVAFKYLLGLGQEQVAEAMEAINAEVLEEDEGMGEEENNIEE